MQQVQQPRQRSLSLSERHSTDQLLDGTWNGIATEMIERHGTAESHSYEPVTEGYDYPSLVSFTDSQANGYPSSIKACSGVRKLSISGEPHAPSQLPVEERDAAFTRPADSNRFLTSLYALERRDSATPVDCYHKDKVEEKSEDEDDYFADARVLKEIRTSIRRTHH